MQGKLAHWSAMRKKRDWSFRFVFMPMYIAMIGTVGYYPLLLFLRKLANF
jgi:hypothetical protein